MVKQANKACSIRCGNTPTLDKSEVSHYLQQLSEWSIEKTYHLTKTYTFPDFVSALAFVNSVGEIAEEYNHHPDCYLSWGKVRVELWTHRVNGLTESDFIIAAKIDTIKIS